MSRQIKFRYWNTEKEKMCMPSSIHWKDGRTWVCDTQGKNEMEYEMVEENALLMQFTGLLDMDKEEIYEGDIVLDYGLTFGDKEERVYSVFCDSVYGFFLINETEKKSKTFQQIAIISFKEGGYMARTCKIIGNIYENKNLIP